MKLKKGSILLINLLGILLWLLIPFNSYLGIKSKDDYWTIIDEILIDLNIYVQWFFIVIGIRTLLRKDIHIGFKLLIVLDLYFVICIYYYFIDDYKYLYNH
ncbi:MAG: hypothetical protein HYZ42_12780 [Bacteroidetes bacterium]|nr:hypothetical protein [Bacteroidota bacterium]